MSDPRPLRMVGDRPARTDERGQGYCWPNCPVGKYHPGSRTMTCPLVRRTTYREYKRVTVAHLCEPWAMAEIERLRAENLELQETLGGVALDYAEQKIQRERAEAKVERLRAAIRTHQTRILEVLDGIGDSEQQVDVAMAADRALWEEVSDE